MTRASIGLAGARFEREALERYFAKVGVRASVATIVDAIPESRARESAALTVASLRYIGQEQS